MFLRRLTNTLKTVPKMVPDASSFELRTSLYPTTVTSTRITPGHFEPFDVSLWVQELINVFHPNFFFEYGDIFGQEINTCTDKEMQIRSNLQRVMSVDVKILLA